MICATEIIKIYRLPDGTLDIYGGFNIDPNGFHIAYISAPVSAGFYSVENPLGWSVQLTDASGVTTYDANGNVISTDCAWRD